MKYKLATSLLVVAALVAATFSAATMIAPPAQAADPFYVDGCPPSSVATHPPCDGDNAILRWDEQLLSVIRAYPAATGPTITARALGVLHTATYDAWAAYDPIAKGTNPNGSGPAQQDKALITEANKKEAISYAAYRVLVDLFPPVAGKFPPTGAYQHPDVLLKGINNPPNPPYDPANTTPASPTDTKATPAAVGNLAAKAVLDFRHKDGSNQLNGYADTTGYKPANEWNKVNDPWRWQPLCTLTPAGIARGAPPVRDPTLTCPDTPPVTDPPTPPSYALQRPLTPQWGKVVPFSLAASQYRVSGPPRNADGSCCSTTEIVTAVNDTSFLNDSEKTRAEYWADGPGSEFPPGHTAVFAQALSRKKGHNLDTDVKLFFLVGNAMMDASIASWYQKYLGVWLGTTKKYDFVRPVTAIREYYKAKGIATVPGAWKGPNQGFGDVPADKWLPYQALNVVTPPFPEYVSGHSTFTSAGATMLAQFNGADTFGGTVIIKAGSSKIEPGGGVPNTDVTLTWPTFSDAANDAGMSRRWGGIHLQSGDYDGRALGRQVSLKVWGKGQNYIQGYIGK